MITQINMPTAHNVTSWNTTELLSGNETTLVPSAFQEDVTTSQVALGAQRPTQLSLTNYLEHKISYYLWLYFAPVLVFGGGLSNLLAVVVLRSRLFRGTGTAFLLTALALADFTVLMTNVLRHWILRLTDYETDVRTFTNAGCKIHAFFTYFGPQWSAWTMVLVTAERVVSVWTPLRAKILCSKKRIVIAWLIVTVAVTAVNAPILKYYELGIFRSLLRDGSIEVYKICYYLYKMETVMYWSDFAMFNVGPSVLIFSFNIFIIIKLTRPNITRQNDDNSKKAVTSVTIMLFVVSVIFLVTTMPLAVYFLGRDTFFKTAATDNPVDAKETLMYAACNQLSYVNNSINFLLYCVSGARFRKATAQMFCGTCTDSKKTPSSLTKTDSSLVLRETTRTLQSRTKV